MPRSEERLSALGYGCMRLPEKGGRIDKPRAERQIRMAIEGGVNYLDTAVPYHMGQSEPFLGEMLQGSLRDRVRLATKLPPFSVRARADMDAVLAAQLKRLRTDRIDFYMFHGLFGQDWKRMEALGAADFLDKAKADGRAIKTGFSFHGDLADFKEIVDSYPWDFCQIQYNYLDTLTQAGTEGLMYAASKGLGVIVMEPLRGGTLVKTVPKPVQALWGGAQIKRSPAEWALRWIWNRSEVSLLLSGMGEETQVEENLRIAGLAQPGSLSDADLALVEKVAEAYRRLMKVPCTGCRYCMPCPAGVDIPACFDHYNRVASFGDPKILNLFSYALYLGKMGDRPSTAFASQCTKCGKCVEKCPQSILIPERLPEVAAEFETFALKLMTWYGKNLMFKRK
jgi:uncharacterized protein